MLSFISYPFIAFSVRKQSAECEVQVEGGRGVTITGGGGGRGNQAIFIWLFKMILNKIKIPL